MSSSNKVIIGSRGSDLALWQANHVKKRLEAGGSEVEIKVIKTRGDAIQHLSFDKIEGKGFFTKEIEEALLAKEIDLAVHSYKDLPTESPEGLIIGAVSEREDPCDLLIINKDKADVDQLWQLVTGAKVGTSSARRKAQLKQYRPDLITEDLRGNVPTRIDKLRKGGYDAILLAAAGIDRLQIDLSEFHVFRMNVKEFVPAPAQGVLALQIRESDVRVLDLLKPIHREDIKQAIDVERSILAGFHGGCHMPLGAYCEVEKDEDEKLWYKVWMSKAENADAPLLQFYQKSENPEKLVNEMLRKANDIKPLKVFITQNKRPGDYFVRSLRSLGFTTEASSLIEFRLVPIKNLPEVEWVFFSSKHAVKYFFIQKPQLKPGVRFGVIGKATGEAIRKFGHRAEFIGQSVNTQTVARQFASLAGNQQVLFPHAKDSLKTVQLNMPKKDMVKNLVVYETIRYDEVIIPEADIVVFTSPSNVEAYMAKSSFDVNKQKAVCIGDATAAEAAKHGIRKSYKPGSFDETGLFQAVLAASADF